LDSYKISNF